MASKIIGQENTPLRRVIGNAERKTALKIKDGENTKAYSWEHGEVGAVSLTSSIVFAMKHKQNACHYCKIIARERTEAGLICLL